MTEQTEIFKDNEKFQRIKKNALDMYFSIAILNSTLVSNENICKNVMPRLCSSISTIVETITGQKLKWPDGTPESKNFFRNINCEFFPCHKNVDANNFNCLFCFCPLYSMKDCGGNPEYLQNGVKDCTNCTLPHTNYDAVIKRLKGIF